MNLFKSDSNQKFNIKRVLSFSYITLLILSVVLIVLKYNDTEKSGLKLFESINTIEKVIEAQNDRIYAFLDSTEVLKKRMDNIINKTKEAIIQREKSQKIFSEQNEILERSNKLTQKQIEEGKPEITTYTPHITFVANDSITTLARIVFTNEGKRIAKNFKIKIIYAFKEKNNDNYYKPIISNENPVDIYPSKMIVITNNLAFSYQDLLSKSNGGFLLMILSYYDELIDNYTANKLIFSLHIGNDNIKIFKESSIPKELEEYLVKSKININIE